MPGWDEILLAVAADRDVDAFVMMRSLPADGLRDLKRVAERMAYMCALVAGEGER